MGSSPCKGDLSLLFLKIDQLVYLFMSLEVLSQLRSGQLKASQKITIVADLTEFPLEILELAPTLEVLDLSNNRLRSLPDDFDRLQNLKILFLSENEFDHLPEVLGRCSQLSMIGFKANQIRVVSGASLPPLLRWLILTDNAIEELPPEIGQLKSLQKLMLAGNQLKTLPEEMINCTNLELIRLAANQLDTLPEWLLTLPKLSWLAFGGNLEQSFKSQTPIDILWRDLTIGNLLGEGASGIIYSAIWQTDRIPLDIAVKLFKGAVTSDGLPESEMQACLAAGSHENLVGVLGQITNHPSGQRGLVLPLLDKEFEILGGPPNFESCTRDTFENHQTFTPSLILTIAQGIASAAAHLHDRGISHGDLYAHNILVDRSDKPVLSDFGAASFYEPGSVLGLKLEQLEVRAFGCLLEDLLDRCLENELTLILRQLQESCLQLNSFLRPTFKTIVRQLIDC
jgi:hypothetical protein